MPPSSAPPHLDAVGPALREAGWALPSLRDRDWRVAAHRNSIARFAGVTGRTTAGLRQRQRLGDGGHGKRGEDRDGDGDAGHGSNRLAQNEEPCKTAVKREEEEGCGR
jgi:hypothetical protein